MPLIDAKLNMGPVHNNNNLTCIIDIRTGGPDVHNSDLLEVCLLPLNHSYRRHPEYPLFHMKFRPSHAIDLKYSHLNKSEVQEYLESLHDPIDAVDLLIHWLDKIGLRSNKKIQPMAFNWIEKQPWIKHWLGLSYEQYISDSYRDPLAILNFINDRNDYHGDEVLIKHPTMGQLFQAANVKLEMKDNLIYNCVALSDAYRYLLHNR